MDYFDHLPVWAPETIKKIPKVIRTKVEDLDTDHEGDERLVPKGTVGEVKGFTEDGPDSMYDILWANGAWTRWTLEEINRDADVLEWR